jgi:hypothetical protein
LAARSTPEVKAALLPLLKPKTAAKKLNSAEEVYEAMFDALSANSFDDEYEIDPPVAKKLKGVIGKMIKAGFQFTDENAESFATGDVIPSDFPGTPFVDELLKVVSLLDD